MNDNRLFSHEVFSVLGTVLLSTDMHFCMAERWPITVKVAISCTFGTKGLPDILVFQILECYK